MPRNESKNSHVIVERMWYDYEYWDGRTVKCCAIVLKTAGCSWYKKSGCTMCGYPASNKYTFPNKFMYSLESIVDKINGCTVVKIYTSGSFLNEKEISLEQAEKIIHIVSRLENVEKVVIESRAEYVDDKKLKIFSENVGCLEVAIGLESSNDKLLRYSINKGMRVVDYVKASEIVKKCGVLLRTYILLKPPLLSEKEGMNECTTSCIFACRYSDVISINPVNVQSGTALEKLWKDHLYRPPWLWTLLEVLKLASESNDKIIMSHPAGAGTKRGVHNCGKCDWEIIRMIRKHAASQEISLIDKAMNHDCRCKNIYKQSISLPPFMGDLLDYEKRNNFYISR